MVHVGGALEIPAVLLSLGADPAEVFAAARVDLDLFDDPDRLISFAARGRLVNQCVAATGCRHFGLLVGQRDRLRHMGLLGLLVKYSPDVGTALRSLVRFFHLRARGAVITLRLDGGSAALGVEIYERHSEGTDQIVDGSLAFQFNILRELCGADWVPSEVRFARAALDDRAPFRRFFRCPLSFDAGQNALLFDAAWLDHRLPTDDPKLRELLQQRIDALEAEHGDDLPAQVRSVLRTALLTRHAQADEVAALFSMHSRTLARRLEEHGTHFQQLADEVRFEIARQMLEQSAKDVRAIAEMLGYADASALTRAFRRWSGTTPATWRARYAAVDQSSCQKPSSETRLGESRTSATTHCVDRAARAFGRSGQQTIQSTAATTAAAVAGGTATGERNGFDRMLAALSDSVDHVSKNV